MSAILKPKPDLESWPDEPDYPESDGKPMADNTLQFQWITVLHGNLASLYREQEVFVAGDLLWYPVRGQPEIVNAPDVMLAFGRPRGHRRSYRQWREDGVAPQVVFEVLSRSNDHMEMIDKQFFYEEHGVEEYYVFDPDRNRLVAYVRRADMLRPIHVVGEYVSPRMGIRFDLSGKQMAVYYPDGRRFLTFEELEADRARERQIRLEADRRADEARQQADEARQQADEARQQADEANRRASRLSELSRKARRGEASPEEIAELKRLEDSVS